MYGPLEIWGPGHLPTLPPSKSGTVQDTYKVALMLDNNGFNEI